MVEQVVAEEVKPLTVDSAAHSRNAARAKRDEEELQKLLKDHIGDTGQEEESSGETVEDTQVQTESDPKQKEATKEVKTQEEADLDAELNSEEKTFKQRYSDIRTYMLEKEKEHKASIEKLEGQLESAAKNELVLPKSDDEIEAWSKKYPDVAGIVQAIANKQAKELSSDLDKRLKEIEDMRSEAKKEKAEAELISLHPDFKDIRNDDAFHKWAEAQPKWVKDALYDNLDDAKSVARVIDLYKVDQDIPTKKVNTEDKAAASSVKARTRNTPEADDSKNYLRESQVNKMTTREYEKRSDEIMEAIRSGKFIYDLSKP